MVDASTTGAIQALYGVGQNGGIPTPLVTDKTLALDNRAADAKSTGDAVQKNAADISELKGDLYNIATEVKSRNLFNKNIFESGFLNSNGSISTSSSYKTSDFIKVDKNKKVIASSHGTHVTIRFLCEYDENFSSIRFSQNIDSITLQSATKYIRFSIPTSMFDNGLFQIEQNDSDTITSYEDYFEPYFKIKKENLKPSIIASNPMIGRKVSWFGDSIIQNGWWGEVSDKFGMTSTNNGIAGTQVSGEDANAMWQDTRINAIPSDVDYIIINAGTNDWARNVPFGEKAIQYDSSQNIVESHDTFYQACHLMFRKMRLIRPNAKIIVLGTPFGKYSNRFSNKYGLVNNLGFTSLDYGNAICDIAEMWGIKAFRYGNEMGIDDTNVEILLDPTELNGHLHPTTPEAKKLFVDATLNCLLQIQYR